MADETKDNVPASATPSPYLDVSAEFIQDLLLLLIAHINLLHVIPEVSVFICWELLHLKKSVHSRHFLSLPWREPDTRVQFSAGTGFPAFSCPFLGCFPFLLQHHLALMCYIVYAICSFALFFRKALFVVFITDPINTYLKYLKA